MNGTAMMKELSRRLPAVPPEDQRIGMVLLHELAKGEPVRIARLAETLGTQPEAIEAFVGDSALNPFIHTDEEGRIQGFWGLSTKPTHHQVVIGGRRLWAWCAVDTLLHPDLLGETARIETRDPETGEMNRLVVSPARVEAAEPTGIVVSVVRPQDADLTSNTRLRASACHFIFFFASPASGERWQAKHPETVLVSLDEAFAFAKRSNARVFGAELARLQSDWRSIGTASCVDSGGRSR
jgi:alkylmercury lyase